MAKDIKYVDLKLLKKLVGELEATLQVAESIKTSIDVDTAEYIIEMSKAAGLCAGVMTEAGMLVGDLQQSIISIQNNGIAPKADLLDKILGPLKGGGSN